MQFGEPSTSEEYRTDAETEIRQEEYDPNESVYEEISEEELESMKQRRRMRYSDQYSNTSEHSKKQMNTRLMIGITILIMVYFVTLYVLKLTGVISPLISMLCMLPAVAAVLIIYLRNKGQ